MPSNGDAAHGGRDLPISIDPATGRKVVRHPRRADRRRTRPSRGYAVVDDERLTTLPPQPPGAVFNAEEQARYREFKEARRGAADYMAMEGEFAATSRTCTRPRRCRARR